MSEACGPSGNTAGSEACPITDALLKRDATAVLALSFTWVGYPTVALISRAALACYSFANNGRVSLFKDVAFGVLDVVSKAGLAAYVAYRTTWVAVAAR